tara:strand:- start:655 stop:1977 length:1323 start_codon:yes stop_codon:yes gene_type:complete
MSKKTVIEYPVGLGRVPYASFIEINKYAYSEAQKTVAKEQNDAFGSLNRSGLADALSFAGGLQEGAYASGDFSEGQDKRFNQVYNLTKSSQYKTGTSVRNKKTVKTVNISDPGVNKDLVVVVNGEEKTVGQLLDEKQDLQDKKSKGLMSSKCMLPLPNEFQYKYGADWNNEFKLGTLALAADDAGRFLATTAGAAVAGGALSAGTQYLSNATPGGASFKALKAAGIDPTKIVQGAAGGVKAATNLYGVNSKIDPTNIAGLAGLAPNENSIQFFQRMQGREFGFRFELAARNKKESNQIIEIIEWFKRGMHPGSKQGRGSAVLLTFPDVFTLTPKFVKCGTNGLPLGDPIQHPMMPKTKLCALTNLTINTTPFGQLQTIFDGSIPLVTMELQFKETTKLTRVDMEGASYTDERASRVVGIRTSDGGFVRDSDKDYTGTVTY